MRKLTNVVLGAAVTALAISALGAPVTASSKTYVQIVNGIPGKKIDVCINKKEIKSALPYGKVVKKKLHAGGKKVKFRKKSRGVCKGKVLAARTIAMPGGSDKTIVATKKKPMKVVIFDNAGLSTPAGAHDAALAVRYAANVGLALKIYADFAVQLPFGPTADTVWTKGERSTSFFSAGPGYPKVFLVTLWVTVPDSTIPLAGPVTTAVTKGQRLQYVVVGSKFGNIRVVAFKQAIELPF